MKMIDMIKQESEILLTEKIGLRNIRSILAMR